MRGQSVEAIDIDKLLVFLRYNKDYLKRRIMLMGGEPTLHPRFFELVKELNKDFSNISIFTNGSTLMSLMNESLIQDLTKRKEVDILVNFYVTSKNYFNELAEIRKYTYKKSHNLLNLKFHCVIKNNDNKELIEKLTYVKSLDQYMYYKFALSCDNQVNIFDDAIMGEYRINYSKALIKIWDLLTKPVPYSNVLFDHQFPYCFFTEDIITSIIKETADTKFLNQKGCGAQYGDCAGLIKTNFDINFCNQTNIKIGNAFHADGTPLNAEELKVLLQNGILKKRERIKLLNPKCKECPAVDVCMVGCYYNALDLNTKSWF